MSSLSCVTLRDLGAGREPQLVARDARPGDAADDLRLDAEVAERLDQRLGDLVLVGGVRALALAGLAQQLRVGQPVAAALGLGHAGAPRTLGGQQRGVGLGDFGLLLGGAVLDLPLDLRERVLLGVERVALGRDGHRVRTRARDPAA